MNAFSFFPMIIIFCIRLGNCSLFMYSSSFATTIILSTSFVEPIAMFRKFLSSFLDSLPQPSAMLFDIERDALLNWEDIA